MNVQGVARHRPDKRPRVRGVARRFSLTNPTAGNDTDHPTVVDVCYDSSLSRWLLRRRSSFHWCKVGFVPKKLSTAGTEKPSQ